ncbi:MAG: MFS transporter [Pseudomonadota bacterium]
MKKLPLSFFQILCMSMGFFGIQHGFSIQFARMSSIYEKLGAQPDEIPFLWLAAPLTGLIIQPIIGYLSDRTWCRLGRRRPYFLTGAILATGALCLMPYSSTVWMAAGLLWILDASINISMEPFRAFVADKLPSKQIALGYAMQTVMIGIGGALGFQIASVDWLAKFPALSALAPSSIHLQFFLCAAIYLLSILITIVTTNEYPPEDLAKFRAQQKENKGFRLTSMAREILQGIIHMPAPMKRLAVVQFFTWLGLFSMWMYYSVGVAHHIFGATDPHSALYEKGIQAASSSMSVYQYVSMGFALLIPYLVLKFGKAYLHSFGLLCAGLGLISVFFIKDPHLLYLSMGGVGIGWAVILSMPYALIVDYIPPEKYGITMGIFNMFIVIPEIIAALGMGHFMKTVLQGNTVLAVLLGGFFMLIAASVALLLKKYEKKLI